MGRWACSLPDRRDHAAAGRLRLRRSGGEPDRGLSNSEDAAAHVPAEHRSAVLCGRDGHCVLLRRNGEGGQWRLHLFDSLPRLDMAAARPLSVPGSAGDEETLSLWPHLVREAGGALLIGVLRTRITSYSGGGASVTRLALLRIEPGTTAPLTEVLDAPAAGSAMIRACFSPRDERNRAGACHDEYQFRADLTLDSANPAGPPRLLLTTPARTYPGRLDRNRDSTTAPPLRRRDLVWWTDPACSYRVRRRRAPPSARWPAPRLRPVSRFLTRRRGRPAMAMAEIKESEGAMRRPIVAIAAALIVLPAAAGAQYEAPANPPDPAAQLAEMVQLYDRICLAAFPDDDAVARDVTARGATPLSPQEVEGYLHGDPGRGWRIAGSAARFDVTIEEPPYHACGVRTMTAAGFPDMAPYRALADRYEQGKGFQRFNPVTMNLGEITTTGGGDQRATRSGGEALLVFLTTPAEGHRGNGQTAVEVRFVHQFAQR